MRDLILESLEWWDTYACRHLLLGVARPNTPFSQRRTSQVIFLHQRLNGARVGGRGHESLARVALPGTTASRCRRHTTGLVVVASLPGGEHCRRPTTFASLSRWNVEQQWRKRGGGKQCYLLLPLVRRAGPPYIQPVDQSCSIQYTIGLCRSMSSACPCVQDVCTQQVVWMISSTAFVDDCTSVRQPHIAWKLSTSCIQWTAHELARSAS